MPRTPKDRNADQRGTNATADAMIADVERPVAPYLSPPGGQATPDRSRAPRIGPACPDTPHGVPAVNVDPPAGPEIGPTDSELPAKQSAYDRARRQGRR
jgi:hypothetical protein